MREAEFRGWLEARRWNGKPLSSISSRMSKARRFERAMPAFGLGAADLDAAFDEDGMEAVTTWLGEACRTAAATGAAPAELVGTTTNAAMRMANVASAVRNYRQFCEAPPASDWPALDGLRAAFLDRVPDFERFTRTDNRYERIERTYKDAMAAKVREIARSDLEDEEAGRRIYRALIPSQSYAYEDFVEGLRPTTGEEGESATAGFSLKPVPGVFRELSTVAEQAMVAAKAGGTPFDLGRRQVFKMSLGRAGAEDHIFDAAIEGDYVVLGWGGEIDWTPFDTYEAIHARWNEDHPGTSGNDGNISQLWRFRCSMNVGDLVVVSFGNTRFRAIGEIVGDYEYVPTDGDGNHRRRVRWLYVPEAPLPVGFYDKPFTMRSCYLLREEHLNREALALLLPGTGGEPTAPKQFVLICDEINRANISKVFGELITLLEPDKRIGAPHELRIALPYSKITDFGVPRNLHVIGTMNTADCSIALIDKALRRRFEFVEMMPDYAAPGMDRAIGGATLARLLEIINERIEYLLDREHQIGHGWLIGCTGRDDLDARMRGRIIPLIAEYFFEDWGRTADVLGGRRDNPFLDQKTLSPPPEMTGEEPRTRWSVRTDFAEDAYRRLVEGG